MHIKEENYNKIGACEEKVFNTDFLLSYVYRVSRIRTDTEQEHVEEPKIRRFNPTYIYTKL